MKGNARGSSLKRKNHGNKDGERTLSSSGGLRGFRGGTGDKSAVGDSGDNCSRRKSRRFVRECTILAHISMRDMG